MKALLLPLLLLTTAVAQSPWESEVAAYEAKERAHPVARGGIVFNGSSSIRLWEVEKSFPDLPVVNHGIGGSTIPENTALVERLIFPLAPKIIVFYAGDNDIATGHAPEQVANDWKDYVKAVRAKLPEVKIIYLSIKPSPARWALWPKAQAANALIKAHGETLQGVKFVEVSTVMLGGNGQPLGELFRDDKLHLLPAGYERWTKLLRPLLE